MSTDKFATPRIISSKTVSLEKLGKTASEPRFRIKSMIRVKTI